MMRRFKPKHLLLFVLSLGITKAYSAPQEKSGDSQPEPLPKGYDESFHTGDIPKPTSPELDPDNLDEEEMSPDQMPDLNPMNDPDLDREPRDFRFGVSAALAIPHMLDFALESQIQKRFAVSLNYGNVSRSLNNIDVSIKHQEVRARFFYKESSFFFGLGLGQHELIGELDRDIKTSETSQTVSAHGKLKATANYFVPHLGWLLTWDSGVILGFDVGYLIPSNAKSSFSHGFKNVGSETESALMESADFKKLKKDLEDSAKKYASSPTPFTSLLRLGWMF